jgi:CO/xanthine dehydrogenase Mo-binding subunit
VLGATPDECTYSQGAFAAGGKTVYLAELARRAGGLEAEADFQVAGPIYDFGAHGAVVRVDPETGAPTIERLVVGFDVGNAINPQLVEGQFVGAAAQGVGGAILEELPFDEYGNPLVTSLMDYRMPTMSEIPAIEAVIDESHPTDHNPLGAKGAGEGGITGVPAAVANAIAHALGDQERVTRIPVDPARLRDDRPADAREPLKEMLG